MDNFKKAILLVANINNNFNIDYEINEIIFLSKSLNIEIIKVFSQNVDVINPKSFLGKGKIIEIKNSIEEKDYDYVFVNEELGPSQQFFLEDFFKKKVFDLTGIILEIFKVRARSKEAKIQIEIASLKYYYPRLKGSYDYLDRQGGGRNRGLGEKKIELERRLFKKQINLLEKQLITIEKNTNIKSKKRQASKIPKVSLVGYTNAGKSSLLNTFLLDDTNKKVEAKNELFTTLDSVSRNVKLNDDFSIILSDTIGFINKIPTLLISAFKSTLKSINDSDLILKVIDISDSNRYNQLKTTNKILEEIKANNIPYIEVYSKVDLINYININKNAEKDKVYISTLNNIGIDFLKEKIIEKVFNNFIEINLKIPYSKTDLLTKFKKIITIRKIIEEEDGLLVNLLINKDDHQRIIDYLNKE